MKIRKSIYRPPRIEMLPLIDIVFLLLVFFIYAMLSMAVHRGMEVDLPESGQAGPSEESPLSVSIIRAEQDVEIYFNKTKVNLEELDRLLRERTGKGGREKLLLFAGKSVPYQSLFLVLDHIKQAGITDISLQAKLKDH
ncbi:MAG: ExbD/TolR family protein [Thermodesulfobacteriota bacterium]